MGKPENNASSPAADEILIKKYPNRRLYNTASSSYIVLDDIVQLVRENTNFRIEDAKSGEDITRSILNQVIFEQETNPSNFHFPLELQKQLIAMYGDSYGAMVPDYLTESMKLFTAERERMTQTVESVVDRNARAMMDFNQRLAQQNLELFKRSWEMFGSMAAAGRSASSGDNDAAPERPDDTEDQSEAPRPRDKELAEIQSKIDALQDRLKSLT